MPSFKGLSLTTPKPTNPRQLACQLLLGYESVAGKQPRKIDELLERQHTHWASQDMAFARRLCIGTLKRWFVFNQQLETLSKRPTHQLEPAVRTVLRLGLLQLGYEDGTPDFAALDESVKLARWLGLHEGAVKLVNGVLRSAQRQPPDFWVHQPEAAWPTWLVQALKEASPTHNLELLWGSLLKPSAKTARINTGCISVEEYLKTLEQSELSYQQLDPDTPECLLFAEFKGSLTQLPGFAEGHIYLQDWASQQVARWLAPKPHEIIVDLCSAPGSKTTHTLALMVEQGHISGHITAVDVSEKRLKRLHDNLERLKLPQEVTSLITCDGLQYEPTTLVDAVIVDAPCSGLGTVSRHADLALQLTPDRLKAYPSLQRQLLSHAASFVKPTGRILYSTCSIHSSENEQVIQAFLDAHPGWQARRQQTWLPNQAGFRHDGFYISLLEKR